MQWHPSLCGGGSHELALEDDGVANPALGGLEALGEHFFGDLGGTIGVVLEAELRTAGFDHHDGDLGVGSVRQRTSCNHEFER